MKNFNSREEMLTYINNLSNGFKECLGKGSSALSYLGNDNQVYKIYNVFENVNLDIINSNLNLEYFIFPQEIYLVDNKLAGYQTKYIKDDILVNTKSLIMKENTGEIDYSKLREAYERFLLEIDMITEKGICLYDLIGNLLFDGENLYAIDVDDYKYVEIDYHSLYQKNIEIVDKALEYELENYYKSLNLEMPDVINELKSEKRK